MSKMKEIDIDKNEVLIEETLENRIKYGYDLKFINDQKFIEKCLKKVFENECNGNIDRFISEVAVTLRVKHIELFKSLFRNEENNK